MKQIRETMMLKWKESVGTSRRTAQVGLWSLLFWVVGSITGAIYDPVYTLLEKIPIFNLLWSLTALVLMLSGAIGGLVLLCILMGSVVGLLFLLALRLWKRR